MKDKKFRPILAGSIDDVEKDLKNLIYPVIASPKVDGIRTLITPEGQFVTRSMKPIRNKFLQKELAYLIEDLGKSLSLDGELTFGEPENVTHPEVFNQTTSAVMSGDGEPICTYWVFDSTDIPDMWYRVRFAQASGAVYDVNKKDIFGSINFRLLGHVICRTPEEVLGYEEECLEQGFEGIMLRKPDMPYKFGRSAKTITQQHLLKLKRFEDAEAEIVGYEELMHNDNEATKDAFGKTERSTCQENLKPGGTLGALKVIGVGGLYDDVLFKIGTGFDHELRNQLWLDRGKNLNRTITYKFQACGSKDAPRFPVFKGFRGDE